MTEGHPGPAPGSSWLAAVGVLCALAVTAAGVGCIVSGTVVDVVLAGDAIVRAVPFGHEILRGLVAIPVVLVGLCIVLFTLYALLIICAEGLSVACEGLSEATESRVEKVYYILVVPALGGLVAGVPLSRAIMHAIERGAGVFWGFLTVAATLFGIWVFIVFGGMGVLGVAVSAAARRRRLRAAKAGDPDAMYQLARELTGCSATPEEKRDGEKWRRWAAELGHREAIADLAYLLKDRADLGEAEIWFRKAAENDHLGAMSELATLLHARGADAEAERWLWRIVQDLRAEDRDAEAERRLREAAQDGRVWAMAELATLLRARGADTESQEWLEKAKEPPARP